jgi:hypothetical protein
MLRTEIDIEIPYGALGDETFAPTRQAPNPEQRRMFQASTTAKLHDALSDTGLRAGQTGLRSRSTLPIEQHRGLRCTRHGNCSAIGVTFVAPFNK